MKGSFDTLKSQYDDINRNYQKETDRLANLQAENKKLNKTVKLLEEKLAASDKEYSRADELTERVFVYEAAG